MRHWDYSGSAHPAWCSVSPYDTVIQRAGRPDGLRLGGYYYTAPPPATGCVATVGRSSSNVCGLIETKAWLIAAQVSRGVQRFPASAASRRLGVKLLHFLSATFPLVRFEPRFSAVEWRRLHGARGKVPHFYKWQGTGAPWVGEQQTRNWPNCTDHHESAHQND